MFFYKLWIKKGKTNSQEYSELNTLRVWYVIRLCKFNNFREVTNENYENVQARPNIDNNHELYFQVIATTSKTSNDVPTICKITCHMVLWVKLWDTPSGELKLVFVLHINNSKAKPFQ